MAFVHLQTHSEFSICRATCRIKDLLSKAAELGQPAVALTDHGGMYGILEFYMEAKAMNKARKKEGLAPITPILGCHIFVDHDAANKKDEATYQRLTLLAENSEGYYNLLKVVSYCYDVADRWREIPGVPVDFIKEKSAGMIAIAGDYFSRFGTDVLAGRQEAAAQYLDLLREAFDDSHFYLALEDQGLPGQRTLNEFLEAYAAKNGVGLVAANNVHYIERDDADAQKVLRCIGLGKKLAEFDDALYPTKDFYFRTEEEMRALFPEHPEAIDNTAKIAERCKVTIWTTSDADEAHPKDQFWPKYQLPAEYADSDAFLEHLCEERLPQRYKVVTDEVRARLRTELDCIKGMHVAGYLLIVWDFINWSREHGIPVGPGRGSAAGSIVTYIIGITNIDPLAFDLLFERFLNPERVSMPDIDTDISDRDRSRVIDYVTEHYGAKCVSQIITYGALKMKQVINDVGRVLGIDYKEIRDNIGKALPADLGATLKMAWTGQDKKGRKLEGYDPARLVATIEANPRYKQLWEYSQKLEGLVRQTGVHAAAVVIAPVEMSNLAPIFRASREDTPVVMYDKHYAEDIGLLKMDFLGLITLSLIQDALALIKKTHGIDLDIDHIPLDDAKTFELLGRGLTVGVFQFESPGMQKYLRELGPERIGDLIAMNALYRPGPIEQIPRFIRCKTGQEPVDCYHKDLEPILSETYGVIVYQEQVMRLAQRLGGYTLGGADIIRRIMAKKKPEDMDKLQPEFFQRCIERGYDEKLVKRIWDVLLPFCGYAFNKSHAAAYAYVAYQTAYLKAHYGAEFMAAALSAEISRTDRIVVLLQECRKLGIGYLPPCVNRSFARFSVDDEGRVLYGLAGVKNVGLDIAEDIVAERERRGPYKDIFDICKRLAEYHASLADRHAPFNKKTLESLILAGALDNLPASGNRHSLLATVDKALDIAARHMDEQASGQISLFDLGGAGALHTAETLEFRPPWSTMELLGKEKDVVGMYLSTHPLEEFRPELIGFATCSLAEDELAMHENSTISVGGLVTTSRSVETKRGDTIGFATIQDFSGELTVFFPKDKWDEYRSKFSVEDRVLVTGRLSQSTNPNRASQEYEIVVDSVARLEEVRNSGVKFIHVSVTSAFLTETRQHELLGKMASVEPFPGERGAELVLHVEAPSGYEHALVVRKSQVTYTQEFLEWLQSSFLASKVWVSGRERA